MFRMNTSKAGGAIESHESIRSRWRHGEPTGGTRRPDQSFDFRTIGANAVPYRIPPTRTDIAIARTVSRYTSPRTERASEFMTWGADEHVMLAITAGWWLDCRGTPQQTRRNSDHLLLTTLAVTLIPHLLKSVFDQRRPDRLTVLGHLHGVPFSGKSNDAFPSGHAMHVGALASAATVLAPRKRGMVWALGAGLVLTRVVLLAHWASDVVAGLALGALTERLLRPFTGFGEARSPSPVVRRRAKRQRST
jgi:PAP2 superfamily